MYHRAVTHGDHGGNGKIKIAAAGVTGLAMTNFHRPVIEAVSQLIFSTIFCHCEAPEQSEGTKQSQPIGI